MACTRSRDPKVNAKKSGERIIGVLLNKNYCGLKGCEAIAKAYNWASDFLETNAGKDLPVMDRESYFLRALTRFGADKTTLQSRTISYEQARRVYECLPGVKVKLAQLEKARQEEKYRLERAEQEGILAELAEDDAKVRYERFLKPGEQFRQPINAYFREEDRLARSA